MNSVELDELMHADSAAAWGKVLFALGRAHGFEKVLFGLSGSRHARLENAFIQSNYPATWRERYDAERLAHVDPVVSHCMQSTLPVIWQPELFRSPTQRALYDDACSHGVRAGVTFPIHGPNGEFGLLSFASDAAPDAAYVRRVTGMLADLALVRDYAFASAVRFCPPVAQEAAPKLTPRELEVLNWVMVGKSSWEISKITGCSEATVNFHMGNIRQKFNVNTRQQAVVRAISLGLITPEDHHR
ncbi:helix-turn-helix transcriptional regulator [Massilia sp. TN1-12]|uniref:helix-turn-helix transcriptional regulator n=1 Tax=Massilia paldalensis TaxID=3377675 RepID=UPI00384C2C63